MEERQNSKIATLGLAMLLVLSGCSNDISTGSVGEMVPRFKLTVTVTNVGDGFGSASVFFSSGVVQSPCPAVLGPGESCSPFVETTIRTSRVEIEVAPEEGSVFVGWTDPNCSGTSGECEISNDAGDFDVELAVEPRFDLIEGG